MGDGVANLWWLFVWSDCLLISPAPKVEEGWFSDTFRRLDVFRCVFNDTWTVFIVNKLGMQYLTVLRGWCWWCGQCAEVGTNGSQRAPRQMNLSWQLACKCHGNLEAISRDQNTQIFGMAIQKRFDNVTWTSRPSNRFHAINCTPLHFSNVDL